MTTPDPSQQPPKPSHTVVASVPRRYGAGTLLIITTVFAALFGILKATDTRPVVIVCVSIYLTVVGVAQWFSGPKWARHASVVAGAVVLPCLVVGSLLYESSTGGFSVYAGQIAFGVVCSLVLGAPAGYLTGVLVAGIFLIMRYADDLLGRRSGDG